MSRLRLFSALILFVGWLLGPVTADVKILSPSAGQSYSASSGQAQVALSWEDDGVAPKLDEMKSFTLLICTGSNTNIECIRELAKVDASTVLDGKYTLTISNNVGTNGAYFVQVYVDLGNGHSITYTPRFRLTGMIGTKQASTDVEAAPPAREAPAPPNGQPANSQSFDIPYTEQTGRIRYAPMQRQPGSKVTAKTWTRKFPKSSVTYFAALNTNLQQESTITPGWSYQITQHPNAATPAPMPSENGLWYNPEKKKTLQPRRVNVKRVFYPTPTSTGSDLQ